MDYYKNTRFEHISRTEGRSLFDPGAFRTITPEETVDSRCEPHITMKPGGGLWASPVVEEYDRSEWHTYMQFDWQSEQVYGGFRFDLDPGAKVLEVTDKTDLGNYQDLIHIVGRQTHSDWVEMARRYDAFHLDRSAVRPHYPCWSVGSLVVFEPEIMQNIEEIPPYQFPNPDL